MRYANILCRSLGRGACWCAWRCLGFAGRISIRFRALLRSMAGGNWNFRLFRAMKMWGRWRRLEATGGLRILRERRLPLGIAWWWARMWLAAAATTARMIFLIIAARRLPIMGTT